MVGDVVAGEPTTVDLVVVAEGLVATVTLAVIGLTADDVALEVTLDVTGSLGVAERVDVLTAVGVALEEDTSRVVTFSRTVDTSGAVVELVVWSKCKDGEDMLVVVVDTLVVTGWEVSVIDLRVV